MCRRDGWRIAYCCLLSLSPWVCGTAWTADCKVRALHFVAALDDEKSVIRRGQERGGITEYRIDTYAATASFCTREGHCFPASTRIDGKAVEALRLMNCKIGKPGSRDGIVLSYNVAP